MGNPWAFLLRITLCKGEYAMNLPELFFIAIGLSMDAFAVAVCSGLTMPEATIKKSLLVGLYFGFFQAVMPLVGYLLATQFADKIIAFDHWIAFALLCFIGGKMLVGSFKKEGCADRECPAETCADRQCPGGERPNTKEASLKPAKMLPLALATSIDALAVGVSFAFLHVNIAPAILSIGIITLILSMLGVKIGNIFGVKFKSKAELVGGVMLVLMGLKILLEHMGIISF
jgi:Predicted membrane protein